jgi:hypothetical protein
MLLGEPLDGAGAPLCCIYSASPVGSPASGARGVSLKNVAQGGDRRVGDWDPRGAHQDESLERLFSAASSGGRRAMPDGGEL